MRKFTKEVFVLAFLLSAFSYAVSGQTNVTGGILSNATWTLANSPYIVTDTVVVYPGITLTIQSGVVVKFNVAAQIEIRQARLLALGTANDSITFTSNTSLVPGMWSGILLTGPSMTTKFNYCIFKYANTALFDNRNAPDTLILKNCNFNNNIVGLNGQGTGRGIIDTCYFRFNKTYGVYHNFGGIFHNCDLSYNQTGLDCVGYNNIYNCVMRNNLTGISGVRISNIYNCTVNKNETGIILTNQGVLVKNTTVDSNSIAGIEVRTKLEAIVGCQIDYNFVAIEDHNSFGWPTTMKQNVIENNSIGIQLSVSGDSIYCNRICSNTTYDLRYTGTSNTRIKNNYWCTTDSTSTAAVIFDGTDVSSFGVITFMPLDALQCYLETGLPSYENHTFSFSIYPNPTTENLTVTLPENILNPEIKIFNMLGQLEYHSQATEQTINIDVSGLTSGIHVIQLTAGNDIGKQKFIRQ